MIPSIKDLTIGPRPIGVAVDHALLTFTIEFQFSVTRMAQNPTLVRYTFTSQSDSIYKDGIYRRLTDKDPKCPLMELTKILTKTIHEAAMEAYPTPCLISNATQVVSPKTVGMMRNAER